MSSCLVSGANSGLGKFLASALKTTPLTRDNQTAILALAEPVDCIIHCAFNRTALPGSPAHSHDNYLLTENLLGIPHRQFVYLSSIDVYASDQKEHDEEELLDSTQASNDYSRCKLANEELVLKQGQRPVILRPASMIGPGMRPNNLTKLITQKHPQLSLTSHSTLNIVTYEHVLQFLRAASAQGLMGVFNLCSTEGATIKDYADALTKSPVYGDFTYNVAVASNRKVTQVVPELHKTSLQIFSEYLSQIHS